MIFSTHFGPGLSGCNILHLNLHSDKMPKILGPLSLSLKDRIPVILPITESQYIESIISYITQYNIIMHTLR